MNIRLIRVDDSNQNLVSEFLMRAGNSLVSFRYFDKRDFTVLQNHLVTLILLENNLPIGYGHLDKENNNVWLGIALIQGQTGKGYGKFILKTLIDFAKANNIENIKLSVDKKNISAIALYESFGFVKLEDKGDILLFSLT